MSLNDTEALISFSICVICEICESCFSLAFEEKTSSTDCTDCTDTEFCPLCVCDCFPIQLSDGERLFPQRHDREVARGHAPDVLDDRSRRQGVDRRLDLVETPHAAEIVPIRRQ